MSGEWLVVVVVLVVCSVQRSKDASGFCSPTITLLMPNAMPSQRIALQAPICL